MEPEVPPGGPAFLKPETACLPRRDTEQPTFDEPPDPEGAPSLGLISRYREIARRHALGQTNNQICEALGYTAAWMSTVLRDPFIQAEIKQWRDRYIDEDAVAIMKRTSVNAALNLERTVLDARDKNSYDASKFVLEKVTGKARQEVTVESGTLGNFMSMLKEMQRRKEPLDVTPVPVPALAGIPEQAQPDAAPRWNTWLTENLA